MPPEAPVTAATRAADQAGLEYRMVHYGDARSAEEAARKRSVTISQLVKTLVVRLDEDSYGLVLVPGDRSMDYPKVRAHFGVRRLTMPDPDEAFDATGFRRGAITPLGAGGWPVVIDPGLLDHEEISLGSGERGWAMHLAPRDLVDRLGASVVDVVPD